MAAASEWVTRVAAWRASGKSSKEFCKSRGYSANSLLWWSSRLKKRGSEQPLDSPVALTRVIRKSEATRVAAAVLVHIGGVQVEVPSGADRATLATVLDVLRGQAGAGGQR